MSMGRTHLEPRGHLPSEACPSELELDRFHFGELGGAAEATLGAHLEACRVCTSRLRARERGFGAFEAVDPDRMFARVEARLARGRRPWGSIRSVSWVPLAAAAAAAFLFVSRTPDPGPEIIRSKGSLRLSVYREHDGAVEAFSAGPALVHSGDRVRFKVDLPEQGDGSRDPDRRPRGERQAVHLLSQRRQPPLVQTRDPSRRRARRRHPARRLSGGRVAPSGAVSARVLGRRPRRIARTEEPRHPQGV